MVDNVVLNLGSGGDTVALEDIGGVKYEKVKLYDATAASTSPTGVTANPLKVDGSGVTQPVSGTVTANAGTNLNTSALALDATITGGTAKAINRGGAKGATVAADVTSTAEGANNQAIDVQIYHGGIAKDPTAIRALTAADIITAAQGTAAAISNGWPVKHTDGTNIITVKAASTAAVATDTSEVIQISPNQPQLTTPLNVQGGKTNNAAVPGATNAGALTALANAAVPAWTEGNEVLLSANLGGALRIIARPPVILGGYRVAAQTAVHSGLAAGAILYSFRWTDATKICRVTRVSIMVNTTTAATVAGMIDRDLVIVRSFTVADSGGTAITLTVNNQKLRTSHATTVVGGIQISSGVALTAGTGTVDAQAIGLVAKQGTASEPVGLTIPPVDLFSYNVGQNYPIVLAQNEGFRIRIPTGMPTTIANRTTVITEWDEIAAALQF